MQEQRPYKMTPEQGWSHMTAILDEAMPVERRSRRTLIYWWTAAAVTSIAIISLIALLDINTTTGDQYSAIQKEELQVSESTNGNTTTTKDAEVSNHTSIAEKQLPESNDNKLQTESTTIGTESNSNKHIATRSKNTFVVVKENTTNTLPGTVAEAVNGYSDYVALQQEAPVLSNEIAFVNESDYAVEDREEDVLAFLPLTDCDELELDINAEISTQPNLKRTSKFRPHLAAGILRSFSNGLGLNIGGGLNVHLGGKFSLTGDVAYQYYDTDAPLSFGTSQDVEHGNDPIIRTDLGYLGYGDYLPAELVNTSSNHVIQPYVKDLHQWQLSGGLRFDASRKFFAEAGAMLSFGIIAHSSYPIIEFDANAPVTGDFFNISNSFNSFDIVKSTTTSVYGGIGYKLSPRTELFAQVVHGLDHYLLNPETLSSGESTKRTDHIRGINVGLRHHLTAGP